MIILDTASADATYMGRVIVIFTVVLSVIILMIGPKFQQLYFPESHIQQTSYGSTQIPRGSGAGPVSASYLQSSLTNYGVTKTWSSADNRRGNIDVASSAPSKGKFGDGVSGLSTNDRLSISQSSVPKDTSSSNDKDKTGDASFQSSVPKGAASSNDQEKPEDASEQ